MFDYFYDLTVALLDKHYPVTSVIVTTRDPPFVTPAIKVMLRRKNRLMRGGRLAEANVLAVRIGAAITKYNSAELSDASKQGGAKGMWEKLDKLLASRISKRMQL